MAVAVQYPSEWPIWPLSFFPNAAMAASSILTDQLMSFSSRQAANRFLVYINIDIETSTRVHLHPRCYVTKQHVFMQFYNQIAIVVILNL